MITPKATRFTGDLLVQFDGSSKMRNAITLQYLVWEIDYSGLPLPKSEKELLANPNYVVIPKGASSDGISAPRFFWLVVPPWGHRATRAALLHDHLLDLYVAGTPHPSFTTRKQIDDVFWEALIVCEVNRNLSYILWLGTRLLSRYRELTGKATQNG